MSISTASAYSISKDDEYVITRFKGWNVSFVYDDSQTDDDDRHQSRDDHDFGDNDHSGLPLLVLKNKIDHLSDKKDWMKHHASCKLPFCGKWHHKDWYHDFKHPTPAVPIPTPIWLLSSGLFALAVVARRNSRV